MGSLITIRADCTCSDEAFPASSRGASERRGAHLGVGSLNLLMAPGRTSEALSF